ncbi:hypothetical protein LPB68_22030 (plasmid) [Paenibacillus crassostreae]|nr:hypothetical protein LPB68_22030 [Paenibacillus crassostreae]
MIFDLESQRKVKKLCITPSYGSLVYCQLGPVEHTGIYIGDRRIVDLGGNGQIRISTLKSFTSHISTLDEDIWFPINRSNQTSIGIASSAERAYQMAINNSKRDYNILLDNCHQFSSGCISGDFENADNFLWTVKHTFEKSSGKDIEWVKWNWKNNF